LFKYNIENPYETKLCTYYKSVLLNRLVHNTNLQFATWYIVYIYYNIEYVLVNIYLDFFKVSPILSFTINFALLSYCVDDLFIKAFNLFVPIISPRPYSNT